MDISQSRILLLGSTGSIGTSALNCIRRFGSRFKVNGLAAGKRVDELISQIREFKPQNVYCADPRGAERIRNEFGSSVRVWGSLEEIVKETDCEIVLNSLVGAVGFRPTVAALELGRRVALANKESLVIGGDYIRSLLAKGKGELLPVDSEHSAILQCLSGVERSTVETIILTASGGPFRNLPVEGFESITPSQALNHPTWLMGPKITIDSSTLMNKGFEVIEAHHLFSLPYSRLRVWIHPQSIIHSLVEFHDGAIMAQLGLPDMELPIQYALGYPERLPIGGRRLSLPEIGRLEFADPDLGRFPCLKLCIEAGEAGGTAPAVVNAANEMAVEAFLNGMITFKQIAEIVAYSLHSHKPEPADCCEIIEETDRKIRKTVLNEFLSKR
ncbi:MAG: 1-deoxy-D-xylulose-5-phosphate reductoisomerase [Fibrobacter sp.]|nr:1-deoxy-D-xylulose-5-phosphate reductoisomerase [Fibrobacter sp.]